MRRGRTIIRCTAFASALFLAGCASPQWLNNPFAKKDPGEIIQANHNEPPGSPVQHDGLVAAEKWFQREEFGKAEGMFEEIADDTKNRPEVAERARYYQAECKRRRGKYPEAVDTYNKLLQDFPAGLYRGQAVGQMYLIASEWLAPTRDELADLSKPEKDRKARSWTEEIIPANFDRKLPTFSAESRALQTLEKVYFNDPTGPYADKALFMLGRVHFHRDDFKKSAQYFQQLAETHDRSPLRDEALKMAIIAKNNCTGGPQYDGKEMNEAMRLINSAKATSPTLSREQEGKFLDEQALMVRYQQAQKDFETAEFYRRTGHPGSAWFYYELVIRRYPGIKPFSEQAATRQKELKLELDAVNNPTTMGATRKYFKQYILGHELPSATKKEPDLKDQLPDPRPSQIQAATGNVLPR